MTPDVRMRTTTVGDGEPVLLLHGFAMPPPIYKTTASLLAERAGVSVVMPWWFDLEGRWSFERALVGLEAILNGFEVDKVTIIGHSFGGGLELGLAVRQPHRMAELVFADTLGAAREWGLADEFFSHPTAILHMATVPAAAAFAWSVGRHPFQLVRAGWWGFVSDRGNWAEAVRGAGIPSHVLWADRDTLLSRDDGKAFAVELGASFSLAHLPGGKPADHDWVFRHPVTFVDRLQNLNLSIFGVGSRGARLGAR